jgi:ribosomal-protein-alanine N-acetyltransferase
MEYTQRPAAPQKPRDTLRIRPVDPSELSGVMDIEVESFPPGDAYSREIMERNRRDSRGGFFVAELNDTLVGYAVGVIHARVAHINSMAVLSRFRNQGIGRRMLIHLFEYFSKQGAQEVALEVSEENAAGIHLYESLGFARVERIPAYYESGTAAIVMTRHL